MTPTKGRAMTNEDLTVEVGRRIQELYWVLDSSPTLQTLAVMRGLDEGHLEKLRMIGMLSDSILKNRERNI